MMEVKFGGLGCGPEAMLVGTCDAENTGWTFALWCISRAMRELLRPALALSSGRLAGADVTRGVSEDSARTADLTFAGLKGPGVFTIWHRGTLLGFW